MSKIDVRSKINPEIISVELEVFDHEYEPRATMALYFQNGTTINFLTTDSMPHIALATHLTTLASLGIILDVSNKIPVMCEYINDSVAKNEIVTITVADILKETKTVAETGNNVSKYNKKFYSQYKKLNGSIKKFNEYIKHLNVFFLLTRESFTSAGVVTRVEANAAWQLYCAGARLPTGESLIIFNSVNQVHAYS